MLEDAVAEYIDKRIEERLDALNAQLSGHYSGIKAYLEGLSAKYDGLRSEIAGMRDGLGREIGGLRDGLTGRIEGLNGRLDGLGREIGGLRDGLTGRIEGLNGRLDGLGREIAGVRGELQGFRDLYHSIDARLDAMGTLLTAIDTKVCSAVPAQHQLVRLYGGLAARLAAIEERLTDKPMGFQPGA